MEINFSFPDINTNGILMTKVICLFFPSIPSSQTKKKQNLRSLNIQMEYFTAKALIEYFQFYYGNLHTTI